jgi:hypothetical protein
MDKTLLDKAKALNVKSKRSKVTEEEIELAVGWAKGEINYSQAQQILSPTSPMNVYCRLALALKEYVGRNGQ